MHEACCEGGSVWEIWNIITFATPCTVGSSLKGLNMKNFHNPIHLLFYKQIMNNQSSNLWLEGLKIYGWIQAEITEQFSVPILFPTSVCWDKTIEKGQKMVNKYSFSGQSAWTHTRWLWWANKNSLKYQTMTLTGKNNHTRKRGQKKSFFTILENGKKSCLYR